MKIKKTIITVTGIGLTSMANAASIAVTEDGYINASDVGVVQGAGISTNLNVRTPNGSGAFQFNNLSFFGFDTTGVDTSQIATANFTVTYLAGGSTGHVMRLYMLGGNNATDSFDETTLTFTSAIADFGVVRNNALTGQRVPGDIVDEQNLTTAGSTLTFNISGTSLAHLQAADTNNFVTFVLEARTQHNNPIVQFASKEHATLDAAQLNFTTVPEPSSAALLGLGASLLVLRRKR